MDKITIFAIKIYGVLQSIGYVFFCQRCLRCQRYLLSGSTEMGICLACGQELKRLKRQWACKTCAGTMTTADKICGVCLQHSNRLSKVDIYAAFAYRAEIKACIWALKFRQEERQAEKLIAFFQVLKDTEQAKRQFDIIIPVPMHWCKVVRRGYNQTDLLARELARKLKIPWSNRVLEKKVDSQSQQSLGRKARWQQNNKQFKAREVLKGKRVLLVDDIITTGATIHACAKACYSQQASKVVAWVIAYTERG